MYWQREEERLYNTVMKVQERKDAAQSWHVLSKCTFCQKALLVECLFCPHCGTNLNERHTTAQMKLVEMSPETTTAILRKYQAPGERPIKTLAKVKRWRMNENKG